MVYIPRGESTISSLFFISTAFAAVNLVNSTTSYVYDLRTQTYLQPAFAYQTLQKILTVNPTALASLQTQQELILEKKALGAGSSLSELINIGLKEQALAPIILDTLMTELAEQTKYVTWFIHKPCTDPKY